MSKGAVAAWGNTWGLVMAWEDAVKRSEDGRCVRGSFRQCCGKMIGNRRSVAGVKRHDGGLRRVIQLPSCRWLALRC